MAVPCDNPSGCPDILAAMSDVGSEETTDPGAFARYLGLEFTAVSGDRVEATWEAGAPLHQPYGIVHGGAHCGVVETHDAEGRLVSRGQVRLQNLAADSM